MRTRRSAAKPPPQTHFEGNSLFDVEPWSVMPRLIGDRRTMLYHAGHQWGMICPWVRHGPQPYNWEVFTSNLDLADPARVEDLQALAQAGGFKPCSTCLRIRREMD